MDFFGKTRIFIVLCIAFTLRVSAAANEIDQMIRQNRMGELTIEAEPGASVRVEQIRHEFWFGAAISSSAFSGRMNPEDERRYKEVFLSNFNAAVTENALKWHAMEPRKGQVDYSIVDAILKWTDENEIPLRGHNIFWGTPGRVQDWVKQLDDKELHETLKNRAMTIGSRYKGRFAEYDLNNEMIHGDYYADRLGPGITKEMATWVKQADPDAHLYLNDYDILTGNRLNDYIKHIGGLLDEQAPIDGVGVQGHLHGDSFDRDKLRHALDKLAEQGLPICITEFNFPGQRSRVYRRRDVKLTPEQEQAKAKALTEYYRICFAHPGVKGVLMWGFWERANWIPQSSLYLRDWTPTPAAKAYRDLVFNQWWTRWEGKADKDGHCRIPAFFGKHRVIADGSEKTVYLKKSAGKETVSFRYPKQDDLASFVVISRRDPRYFELSNGSPYIPIGFNLVGPPREEEFDRLFKIMADNKINYCRVWVSHSDWNVEHEQPLQFDPDRAKTIDRFLSLARKNGVRVKMCLEYFRDIRPDRNRWSDNLIYHKANGGPFEGMHDYLSSERGRSHFKAKLDWYANRYGDDPAVFAWELWNEMDAVRGSEWLDWTRKMLPELHSRFPRNLAVQSLGSYDWEDKRQRYKTLCLLKDNDVAQVHRYLDEGAGWEICHGPVDVLASEAVRELIAFNPGKPIILTETGAVKPRHTGCSELYAKDQDGILLHDMLFAPFFSGAAGTGHVWWWRQALDGPNLWYHFARFAEAVKGIDPPGEHFEPVMISENRCRLYVLKGRKTVLAWCRDSRNDWENELVLGHQPEIVDGLEIDLNPFLTGSHQTQARVFDPWKNRWQDMSIESGRIRLDAFKRSVVIRVE